MCRTCQDNGLVGDKDKCKSCSRSHPFMYSPDNVCYKECGIGYYEVNKQACDKCSEPCKDCFGDKFNCTLCDAKSKAPALFTGRRQQGNKTITRSTCYKQCPNGFFMDKTKKTNVTCQYCEAPCSTCVDKASKCLACDGSGNRNYVWNY